MADRTGIEWANASLNPIRARDRETRKIGWFCEHATPGCEHCYAEAINHRLGTRLPYIPQSRDQLELFLDEKALTEPLRWQKPRRIFWCSMTDPFASFVEPEWLDRIFAVAALTPQHEHLLLTKRAPLLSAYIAVPDLAERVGFAEMGGWPGLSQRVLDRAAGAYNGPVHRRLPLRNVLLGVSVEDQRRADERHPYLAAVADRGWRTFVSYEPALGPVDWQGWEFLKQLISGGESGPKARGTLRAYFRSARDFCAAHDIAYFHKQNGEWIDADEFADAADTQTIARIGGNAFEHHSDGSTLIRVGKRAAGRLLDGVEHSEMPI